MQPRRMDRNKADNAAVYTLEVSNAGVGQNLRDRLRRDFKPRGIRVELDRGRLDCEPECLVLFLSCIWWFLLQFCAVTIGRRFQETLSGDRGRTLWLGRRLASSAGFSMRGTSFFALLPLSCFSPLAASGLSRDFSWNESEEDDLTGIQKCPKQFCGAKTSAPVGHLCGRRTIMYVFMCFFELKSSNWNYKCGFRSLD